MLFNMILKYSQRFQTDNWNINWKLQNSRQTGETDKLQMQSFTA